jgi:hypothetical protein
MLLHKAIDFDGTTIKSKIVMDNTQILALNKFLRSLPLQERAFFKDCYVESIIPVYMPAGLFEENEHAHKMDDDQIDWLLKKHPEFRATDDRATTKTGVVVQ